MPLAHSTAVAAGAPLYRITSPGFLTSSAAQHRNVVNGQGALHSSQGARYNYPGAVTVYLAEDIATCLAEAMFYFQREYLQRLDVMHIGMPGAVPSFTKSCVLWKIEFQNAVSDVADLNTASAGHFGVFPAMMTNPSQDYWHLKDRRGGIEPQGYKGIRAASSRATGGGHILALFQNQRANVQSIEPAEIELRLVEPQAGGAFYNHATQELDFEACEVRVTSTPTPVWANAYTTWTRVAFNH